MVTQALADARFEVACLTALRDGRAAPQRTAPCFVDPRHGPSVGTTVYPAAGLTAAVPVCAACQAQLVAGQQPVARTFLRGGVPTSYWLAAGPAWFYLNGYWGGQPWLSPGLWPHHPQYLGSPGSGGHHGGHGAGGGIDPPDSGGGGFFGGGGGFGGGRPRPAAEVTTVGVASAVAAVTPVAVGTAGPRWRRRLRPAAMADGPAAAGTAARASLDGPRRTSSGWLGRDDRVARMTSRRAPTLS